MSQKNDYLPFSQRNGLAPVPPQLLLGEVSPQLRRLIDYSISKEIRRVEVSGYDKSYFVEPWLEVARDLHVKFFEQSVGSFEYGSYKMQKRLERNVELAQIGRLFDLVEFFIRHAGCSAAMKHDLADAFVTSKAAYRIVDDQLMAIGTGEQAQAVESALAAATEAGASAARQHLIQSGLALRAGSWADSVRESIHAVEAMARRIEPDAITLAPALKALEKRGYIHGSLKLAFEKLYGYANDEGGIRHALLEDEARVDEVDALFMIGACASFVSYLISRSCGDTAESKPGP